MDPNATLAELRGAASRIVDELDHERQPDLDDVQRIAEAFQDLDEWLSKGGFLPADWTNESNPFGGAS